MTSQSTCPYCGGHDLHTTEEVVDPKTGHSRPYNPATGTRLVVLTLFISLGLALFLWVILPTPNKLLFAALAGVGCFGALIWLNRRERQQVELGLSPNFARLHHFTCNTCGFAWEWRVGQPWPQVVHPIDLNPLYAAAPPNSLQPLKRALLEQDVRLLASLRGLFNAETGLVSGVLSHDTTNPDADKDLGFGGRHVERLLIGGYTRWQVNLLAFDDQPINLTVHCEVSGEAAEALASALVHLWKGEVQQRGPTSFVSTYDDEVRFAAFRHRVAAELGATEPIAVPDNLAPAYDLLTSLDSRLHVGTVCYVDARKPDGRVAIETLQAAGRLDLIRNVLRSLNPEGRIYAAQALLALSEQGTPLNDADVAAIATLCAQPTPIIVCMGCTVFAQNASALLPQHEGLVSA